MPALAARDIDAELLAALSLPQAYPEGPPVDVRETHASRVFLAGERAYKVKKPVALEFLDYSTLARRHTACREEVRVNHALAPDIYIGVRAIVRTPDGIRLADEDSEDAIEYAVEMRRFAERDTLAGLIAAEELDREQIARVGCVLARFHLTAAAVSGWTLERVVGTWQRNIEELAALGQSGSWHLETKLGFASAFVAAGRDVLERRAHEGLVRDGHGDLRAEHVLVRPEIRIVDRIEFDPTLRELDVANDLAFLAMDLEALGQRGAAHEFIAAYRESGLDVGSERLRSFYGAHWALVRAKVALLSAREHEPRRRSSCLAAAERLAALSERLSWRARGPLAFVICGPAASGKSSVARELGRRAEIEIVSSDLVRKRLAGVMPTERARARHYSPEFTRATYAQVAEDAVAAIRRGTAVAIDASCHTRAERAPLLASLRAHGAIPLVVRCTVPRSLAERRARERMDERGRVSDATPAVVAAQFTSFEELDEVPASSVLALDTTCGIEDQLAVLARAVDARGHLPLRA